MLLTSQHVELIRPRTTSAFGHKRKLAKFPGILIGQGSGQGGRSGAVPQLPRVN